MDPFSSDGELIHIRNHFLQGQWQEVVDYDTSSLSPTNALPAKLLAYRAQIALGDGASVIKAVKSSKEPELQAVGALADLATGNNQVALRTAEKLAATHADNGAVQVLAGTVLQAEGLTEEALTLLSKHQGNLEAVALTVQINLQQNRTDLALKEVAAAKRWAQDSLQVNIAESWTDMRVGGTQYQKAFYVFEEMAQAAASTAPLSLVSQAIAEMHQGRYEEAEPALRQALELDPKDTEAIANLIVLSILTGSDTAELTETLRSTNPGHVYLKDLEEKSDLFDKAAATYSPKVSA